MANNNDVFTTNNFSGILSVGSVSHKHAAPTFLGCAYLHVIEPKIGFRQPSLWEAQPANLTYSAEALTFLGRHHGLKGALDLAEVLAVSIFGEVQLNIEVQFDGTTDREYLRIFIETGGDFTEALAKLLDFKKKWLSKVERSTSYDVSFSLM